MDGSFEPQAPESQKIQFVKSNDANNSLGVKKETQVN